MRVVNVPIVEAMLFIPPDGEDRDLDLSNRADRKAMRKIRAQDYIQARDGRNRPDWIKGPHRLYCPCCAEKGHLSRHMGMRAHDRPYKNYLDEKEFMHRPASFVKRHDALDHLEDCEFAHRYTPFEPIARVSLDEIGERRRLLHKQLHTISVPTGNIITMPPRRIRSCRMDADVFGEIENTGLDPRALRPSIVKAPPLSTIEDIAGFIARHRFDPEKWDQKLLDTPEGPQSLSEIFMDSNADVAIHCRKRQHQGLGYGQVIASLLPNRIAKYWEGRNLPSQPTGKLAVLFSAQNEEALEHMKALFSPKRRRSGERILAYGLAGMREDGRPEIRIFRPEQITSWHEPNPQMSLF